MPSTTLLQRLLVFQISPLCVHLVCGSGSLVPAGLFHPLQACTDQRVQHPNTDVKCHLHAPAAALACALDVGGGPWAIAAGSALWGVIYSGATLGGIISSVVPELLRQI